MTCVKKEKRRKKERIFLYSLLFVSSFYPSKIFEESLKVCSQCPSFKIHQHLQYFAWLATLGPKAQLIISTIFFLQFVLLLPNDQIMDPLLHRIRRLLVSNNLINQYNIVNFLKESFIIYIYVNEKRKLSPPFCFCSFKNKNYTKMSLLFFFLQSKRLTSYTLFSHSSIRI